jgi:NAD(P)-dependent dehydrogenase (short-subunit alcohol dehydrogenase family)
MSQAAAPGADALLQAQLQAFRAEGAVSAAALFLASPAAGWITGKILGVDGGVEAPNF